MMNALRSAIAHAPTPRSMMLRRIVLPAMACVLVSLANTVSAVGLGEAHTSSRIGQTLRIEIPIQSEQGEPISATCFRLAAPPASDSDDLPWLSSARLGIDEANGNRQLIIVGAQTNENPIVRFGVVIGCDVGLRRDYTLLLDPPDFNATGPVVSESNSPPIAPTWTQSLAQSPSTASAATTISPEFATPPATPVAAKSMLDSSVPSVPKRKRTRTAPHDRLVVGTTDSGEGSALQLATSIAKRNDLSEKERAKLRLELQLIATLDDKIATQVELTDKLRQLEALQAKLQTDSNELEAQIHAQQIKNQTLIPPRPVAVAMQPVVTKQILPLMPERIWLYLPGGLLALLLVTWFWLRRSRYQSDEEHSIAVPKTPGGGATAAGHADEMFEPLS
ncbi:MAG TPA: hypothetical protein VFW00_14250, partial [Rhodocyclaceae bacterium]|nr:hypothetical protein [Rhodocyclaceae bacterium]